MKNFTEEKALWDLQSKRIAVQEKTLFVNSGDIGIKNLAKVDFLVNHKGYRAVFRRSEKNETKS